MAELFKNIYNKQFFDKFTKSVKLVIEDFNTTSFLNSIFDDQWESRELKQRMRHISITLKEHLSDNYVENVNSIIKIIEQLKKDKIKEESVEFMFFPDFIELYGLEQYDISIEAFENITQFTSCEFAVRPFIIKYQEEMVKQMYIWSTHEHDMVRRLASEGCRPRLPWAMAIPAFKKDPESILTILDNLKQDRSESVRRSVANNLNDISKDNPETVIKLATEWKGKTKETDWLVKHACRTLLKQGNFETLRLFGFSEIDNIKILNFQTKTSIVEIGQQLEFSFTLVNTSNSKAKIRLEYGLYYLKANGTLSKKVFKISEKEYNENSKTDIVRRQSFKIITTRKFHIGLHQLSIIINGKEFDKIDFKLTN